MSGIDRDELLNCIKEEDDENEELKEFYESNISFLKEYPSNTVLADIARMLHGTTLQDSIYWRDFAVFLGFNDNDMLDRIQVLASKSPDHQELYILFDKVCKRTMGFDFIIRMLIAKKCYNILRKKRQDFVEFIEKSRHNTEVKAQLMIEPDYNSGQLTMTPCSNQEHVNETFLSDSSNCNKSNMDAFQKYPFMEKVEKEFNNLQLNSTNNFYGTGIVIPNPTVLYENRLKPSAPAEENPDEEKKISVFIQHTNTESDIEFAKQLCKKLREAEFKVKAMCEIDVILALNEIEALPAILKEVDFIVPVVSENLFKQIHASDFTKFADPADASINHSFYHLIKKEYHDNACYNYRVRPVIVPGMDRQKLRGDVILSYSLRFGAEDQKLIRVLKETKQLIPQYCLQPNRR